MGRLDNRVAIVTGGGSGMGRAISTLFAREGCRVVVADLLAQTAAETRDMITAAGGISLALGTDVSDPSQVERMIAAAVTEFGVLDILVNCAGVAESESAAEPMSEKEWDGIHDVNVKGPFWACKHAIPHMRARGTGAIVNISSICGMTQGVGPAYSSSKHAIIGLTQQLAVRYAAEGIRVNAIAPGSIATPMLPRGDDPDAPYAYYSSRVPMGRPGEPREIAAAVLFLASDDASYVTGAVLPVDGAWVLTNR